MDQRRLEPLGKRAQFLGCGMRTGAAHNRDAAGFVDAACDLADIFFTGGEFGTRLEREEARNGALGLCGEDVHWRSQMRDAAACIGLGDGLMDDGWRRCHAN